MTPEGQERFESLGSELSHVAPDRGDGGDDSILPQGGVALESDLLQAGVGQSAGAGDVSEDDELGLARGDWPDEDDHDRADRERDVDHPRVDWSNPVMVIGYHAQRARGVTEADRRRWALQRVERARGQAA